MLYALEHTLRPLTHNTASDHTPTIALYNYDEWRQIMSSFIDETLIPSSLQNIIFCRVTYYPTYLFATLAIPIKHHPIKKRQLIFIVEKNKLTFIDDTDFTQKLLEDVMAKKYWKCPHLTCFLADFLETLIQNDLFYVEELENKISKLEVAALNGDISHFDHRMMTFRKELLTYHYFYSQLIDITDILLENENNFLDPNQLHLLEIFSRRVERLQNIILMLKDSATQVREEYQSQIDLKQNHTMRILTVVTSIFLPLTLIVGWYGMNFESMPELSWQYGYPYVTLLSIAITLICLWIFKRIHFL